VLAKVFRGLRSTGVRPHDVADELGITVEELNTMLFGLVITAVQGGRTGGAVSSRPRLTLVTRS
jgi:hypothetical protein